MFRCDFDVMESLESLEELEGSERSPYITSMKKEHKTHVSTLCESFNSMDHFCIDTLRVTTCRTPIA